MISDRERKGEQTEGERLTEVRGLEELFNLVYFVPLSSKKKRTVSIPLHPSLPGLQLIVASHRGKRESGRKRDRLTYGQTEKEMDRLLKHCRAVKQYISSNRL